MVPWLSWKPLVILTAYQIGAQITCEKDIWPALKYSSKQSNVMPRLLYSSVSQYCFRFCESFQRLLVVQHVWPTKTETHWYPHKWNWFFFVQPRTIGTPKMFFVSAMPKDLQKLKGISWKKANHNELPPTKRQASTPHRPLLFSFLECNRQFKH